MALFDPTALRGWLIERDVRLCPPASENALEDLRSTFQGSVHPDVISLYQTFDGCDDGDFDAEHSFSIWPISKGLEYARKHGLTAVLPFADAEFSSDVALCSVLEPMAPVRWHDGMLPKHSSLASFFDAVQRGKLWS